MRPDDVLDYEAGRLMHDRGYGTRVALLIKGKSGKDLAILILSWQREDVLPEQVDRQKLEEYRRDLSFTLSS
jgi:hypothetical protein